MLASLQALPRKRLWNRDTSYLMPTSVWFGLW